jgi:hypothetical protein
MSWFKKNKKVEEKPLPKHKITVWGKKCNIFKTVRLDIIPRVGERVMLESIFDKNSPFYEVIQVYHMIGDNNIVVVVDEPP